MSREPNHRLAAVMAEAGATNKGLARRVRDVAAQHGAHLGTTHVAVQRWLDGNGIQPETAAYVAEALSGKLGRRVTPVDLGFPTAAAKAFATGAPYAGTVSEVLGILDGLTQLAPGDESARAEKLSDVDVNSAVLSWMVSRPDGPTTDAPGTRRVGMRDVHAIRTAAEMFARLDFLYGGGHGHTALRHYFRHEVLPLLGATILVNMSHQANYLGQTARAAQLARAAIEGGRGQATPRAEAVFAAHEARALSSAQDFAGAARAMNEAERHFERADTAQDPAYLAYVNEAEIIGEISHCFRDLKRPAESLRFAEQAVDQTDPQYARTLAFCRMVLAQSQFINGDLEAAVTTANLAVDEGESLQSARFVRYVEDFQREINGHSSVPAVATFNEKVAVARAELEA